MKLLVMSDTHGDAEVINKVRESHPSVDAVIHCGDSELPFDHPYLEGVLRVRGNCDRDDRFVEEELVEMNGVKIFVAHGHLLNVKSNIMNLYYRAKELEADAVFFGHSHVLGSELMENILFVNPGSLLKPRARIEKSYCIVEFDGEKWLVTAFSHQGDELFSKQYPLENFK